MATKVNLGNLDVTFLIDRSGSMAEQDGTGLSRYKRAEEFTVSLAQQAAKYDEDGIGLYLFNAGLQGQQGVTADAVKTVFEKYPPSGGTHLGKALTTLLADALKNSAGVEGKQQLIVCITDGQPSDGNAAAQVIANTTRQMKDDAQIAILFVQYGDDAAATAYLKGLDDALASQGATFDIVDTDTEVGLADLTFEQVVEKAFND